MTPDEACVIRELLKHYYRYPPKTQAQIESWRETKEAFSETLNGLYEKSTDILVLAFDKCKKV